MVPCENKIEHALVLDFLKNLVAAAEVRQEHCGDPEFERAALNKVLTSLQCFLSELVFDGGELVEDMLFYQVDDLMSLSAGTATEFLKPPECRPKGNPAVSMHKQWLLGYVCACVSYMQPKSGAWAKARRLLNGTGFGYGDPKRFYENHIAQRRKQAARIPYALLTYDKIRDVIQAASEGESNSTRSDIAQHLLEKRLKRMKKH